MDNTSINPTIALQELDIQLPIGSDAADLTSDFSGLGYTVNPADVWKISPNASTNTFVIKPKSGTPQSITGQSLSITISGTVNQQLGACNFYLTEMTGTDQILPIVLFYAVRLLNLGWFH